MKLKGLLTSVAAAAVMLTLPVASGGIPLLNASAVQAQSASVSVDFFFGELQSQGSWVRHPRHRYVWVPRDVDRDWSPYTRGRWVYTERHGWYFDSREPFAWAVYHYGRWGYSRDIGWFWVPGTTWAPAWVSWRRGEEHVGWAPLPPQGEGYSVSVEVSFGEPPRDYYHFVPVREFLSPDLAIVIIDRDEAPVIYERTEVLGTVVVQNNVVINNVVEVNYIEQQTNTTVNVVNVQAADSPEATQASAAEGTVTVFQAEVEAPAEDVAPAEVAEPADVQAPTAGQEIQPTEEAAPAAGEQPANSTTAPANSTTAPANATTAPANTTTAPANTTAAPVNETTAPANSTTAPANETTAPANETTAPANATTAPANETTAPANATAAPVNETEAPAEEEAAPAEEEAAPAEEEAAPAEEEAAPAEEEAAPAEEEAAPAEEEAAPAEECTAEQIAAGTCPAQ